MRSLRVEAASAIKTSTLIGVGRLMRRDFCLGMFHGLLHPLERLFCLRMIVLVRMKLLRQLVVMLGKLWWIHLLHSLDDYILWSVQEFVHQINFVMVDAWLIVLSEVLSSHFSCHLIDFLFLLNNIIQIFGWHLSVAISSIASYFVLHGLLSSSKHFFLLLGKFCI